MINTIINLLLCFDGILLSYLLHRSRKNNHYLEKQMKHLLKLTYTEKLPNQQLQDENDFANETIIHLNNEIYDKQQEIYRLKNLQKKKKKDITNRIPFIELEFGEGLIRYYENGVYYHGIGSNEKQKWNKDNKWDKSILLFPENRRIIKPYTTHNIDEYCNNCILDEQLSNEPGPSRNKTKYQVFKCLGHEY